MGNDLYQKTGIAVNRLAQDFLTRKKGERIPSISEYQEKLGVSRGTIQNGLNYLKERQQEVRTLPLEGMPLLDKTNLDAVDITDDLPPAPMEELTEI